MAAVDFDGAPTITQNFSDDPNQLEQAIKGLKQSGVMQKAAGGFGNSMNNNAVDYGARSLMLSLQNLAQNMATVPGRKAVVLFSKGFPFTEDRKLDLELLVKTCAHSNVAIYTVDPSGVSVMGPGNSGIEASGPTSRGLGLPTGGGRSAGQPGGANVSTNAANQQILTAIADETGGASILNTNDFLAAMQRAADDQTQGYVLSFVPTPAADGSCHSIHVKLDRPGNVVRARHMYCNSKPVEALAGKPAEKQLETLLTGPATGTIPAAIEAPFFYQGSDVARVNIVLEASARGLKFEREKGKLHSQLDVLGIAYRADGSVGGRFSDSVSFDVRDDNATLESFVAQPLHYEKQFELPPGEYHLKVVFSSDGSNFGKVETPLKISPYDGKELALSGIALSRQMRPVSQLNAGSPESLSDDRAPLIANGMEVIPSGTSRFSKSLPMALYTEIYEPALSRPNPPKLGLVLQIIDAKTGNPVKNSGLIDVGNMIRPGSAIVPVGINVPVSSLDPGQYRLELQAGNSAGKVSKIRETDFVVLP